MLFLFLQLTFFFIVYPCSHLMYNLNMNLHESVIKKFEKGQDVYYTVHWSPLLEADKYLVNKHCPAMAGIVELYYMDKKKKLCTLRREHVWYGGVRGRLREAVDPDLEIKDKTLMNLLEKATLYCRYSLSESIPDMSDILFFLPDPPIAPKSGVAQDSGRYKKIYVNEVNAEKIITI